MRTKLFALILFLGLGTAAFSQHCANDSLTMYPPGDVNYVGDGFLGPESLPCIKSGSYSEIVIPFSTYNQGARLLTLADSSTVPVSRVYSLRVDDITNLPSGLCWTTRSVSNTITGEQVGMLIIKGTTSAPTGILPLSATISVDVQGAGSFTYTGLLPAGYKTLLGQPVLKIADANGTCPSVN